MTALSRLVCSYSARPSGERVNCSGCEESTRNSLRIPCGVQAAAGVANWHAGALDVGVLEQGVQFAGDLPGVLRFRTGLAPAQLRAVVGAHACGSSGLPLHTDPVGRHTQVGSFKDHRGAAFSDAVDVQAVTAHADQLAGWRIGSPDCGECQEGNDQHQ